MIYLDNAATSYFKPDGVADAIIYDLTHSANSGRSGHKYALTAAMKIESCREYLLNKLGAADRYQLIFTKNCTEALNLGIFGILREGARVVTTANEHNSVLRPLFELKKKDKIQLFVVSQQPDGTISPEHLARAMEHADFCIAGAVSNVTGARLDLDAVGNYAEKFDVPLFIDGAQAVPLCDIDMKKQKIDMLACPGHKGLHGMQGTGFLIYRKDFKLEPLIYGGTGTSSDSVYQPPDAPEAFEAGTLFAGGIAALHAGAIWSFDNAAGCSKEISRLSAELIHFLKNVGATVYTRDTHAGVISFNLRETDSSFVSDALDKYDVAVRSGLHCAPLTHKFLKTVKQGAVRASLGVDTTEKDIYKFAEILEKISRKL